MQDLDKVTFFFQNYCLSHFSSFLTEPLFRGNSNLELNKSFSGIRLVCVSVNQNYSFINRDTLLDTCIEVVPTRNIKSWWAPAGGSCKHWYEEIITHEWQAIIDSAYPYSCAFDGYPSRPFPRPMKTLLSPHRHGMKSRLHRNSIKWENRQNRRTDGKTHCGPE